MIILVILVIFVSNNGNNKKSNANWKELVRKLLAIYCSLPGDKNWSDSHDY